MAKEYIEREAVVATIEKHMANVNDHCYSVNHDRAQYDIYAMATSHAVDYVRCVAAADVVEVVHGRWEPTPEYGNCWCSCCKKQYTGFFAAYWNYCPNCGARMDGE